MKIHRALSFLVFCVTSVLSYSQSHSLIAYSQVDTSGIAQDSIYMKFSNGRFCAPAQVNYFYAPLYYPSYLRFENYDSFYEANLYMNPDNYSNRYKQYDLNGNLIATLELDNYDKDFRSTFGGYGTDTIWTLHEWRKTAISPWENSHKTETITTGWNTINYQYDYDSTKGWHLTQTISRFKNSQIDSTIIAFFQPNNVLDTLSISVYKEFGGQQFSSYHINFYMYSLSISNGEKDSLGRQTKYISYSENNFHNSFDTSHFNDTFYTFKNSLGQIDSSMQILWLDSVKVSQLSSKYTYDSIGRIIYTKCMQDTALKMPYAAPNDIEYTYDTNNLATKMILDFGNGQINEYRYYYDEVSKVISHVPTQSFESAQIVLYPNPSQGILIIQGLKDEKTYKMNIYSIHGQIVFSQTGIENGTQIELPSALSDGTYFVELVNKESSRSTKLVIKRQ